MNGEFDNDAQRHPLMPSDTPDYMAPAWAGCLSWAIGEPEIRATFERETRMKFAAPKSGLDRMIDEATGHSSAYVKAFIEWANVNVWGPVE